MLKEHRICKSFEPIIYPLRCGDPNRNSIIDGLCLQDNDRRDADDCCDKFEQNEKKSE
jgi:hypothetical protein